ncbi:phosphatase PAP2 family protein [Halococcoides cellulosivorans]|uniref:Phosphoesterase PA-phosphatase n=1 Tax=Halococcoides cellulosivorans TaxID=1679096 RepID=A0A2R4WYK9_9EURY|nr:phosphatase PAP2 family protein [Halococcoides cellulosivorans]AWB26621.1 phosphoesterase PA-phosphatase [Halococcoides cellulosivorans]
MTRRVGLVDLLAGLPDPIRVGAALLTQLGDVWWLIALTVAVWIVDRRRPIVRERSDPIAVLALVIGGYALTTLLKAAFGLPRPPIGSPTGPEWLGPVGRGAIDTMAHADGFGFPSGHAIGATLVYGALARRVTLGTARQRAVVAAGLVGLIATTRLVLGVHYLVDVLAGIAIAVALLAVIERFRPGPRVIVGAATALAGLAAVLTLDPRLAAAAMLPVGGWALAARLDRSLDR